MNKIEFVPYIPEVATYRIFYPEAFLLNEEEETGIVTITSPEGKNMTLSSYSANSVVTEEILISFFEELTEGYNVLSELIKNTAGGYHSFEQHFKKEENFWVWWVYSKSNQIVAVSVNSEEKLNDEEYSLFRFMANNMEILEGDVSNY
jgi:hypothetical protein